MASSDTSLPTYTERVDQTVFIEPLGGPSDPRNLLDRFPDELYDKSPETHFVRFMYSLLGPAGVGWIKKQYLDAKLKLYAQGFDTFDIERYYGNPFRFGRVLLEELPEDPNGLLTREQWDVIKSRDESYRNRAITFFNAARAGNSPAGMELAARSGLNHAVSIVENYRYLFDQHSDEPLNLSHYGQTFTNEEFIIIPRQESSQSETQALFFADVVASSGSFTLSFRGQTTAAIDWNADFFTVESRLKALGTIGSGGVQVRGGPNPNPFTITFTGPLSGQDVPLITVTSSLKDNYGDPVNMYVRTFVGGVQSTDEIVELSDEYAHNMQTAIDFLRPVNTLPTAYQGVGSKTRQLYQSVSASSQYTEVIRYITGTDSIAWPEPDSLNWIEPGKEKEYRRIQGDLQQHYVAYHTPAGVAAYTEEALADSNYTTVLATPEKYKSIHVGRYDPRHVATSPHLDIPIDNSFVFTSESALASCSESLEVTSQNDLTATPLLGGTLSTKVTKLLSTSPNLNSGNRWWSSLERTAPAIDYLQLDLEEAKVVNWISFDIARKHFGIDLDYDHFDQLGGDVRKYRPVSNWDGIHQQAFINGQTYIAGVVPDQVLPSWQHIRLFFRDTDQHNITTRFLRLKFVRPEIDPTVDFGNPFYDYSKDNLIPYSVDIRNLRVGRYYGGSTPNSIPVTNG